MCAHPHRHDRPCARNNAGVPIAFDTDVNAPAVTEAHIGNHGEDVKSLAYITVGTGVGVGAIVNGESVKGLMHMEGGHVLTARHPNVCVV